MTDAAVVIRACDPRDAEAVACLQSYYAELNRRFDHGFDVTRSADPEAASMTPPKGTFLLADVDGRAMGCVGLKGHGDWGEVKRLWVSPEARGLGLARRLMATLEDEARTLGMGVLRLDTNNALHEAVAMYRALGWTEIGRFNDDPYPDAFFERTL
ncbi:GNAT family N-acetyltransferase [Roseivivax sp. CAU 1753]